MAHERPDRDPSAQNVHDAWLAVLILAGLTLALILSILLATRWWPTTLDSPGRQPVTTVDPAK